MQCVLNVGMGLYWYSIGKILANQSISLSNIVPVNLRQTAFDGQGSLLATTL